VDPRIKRLYWQITALLLAAHFAGWAAAMPLSLALTALQTLHFLARPGWTGCSVRSTTRAGGPRNQRLASQFDNCARQAPDVRRLAAPLNTSDPFCQGQLQWT